MTGSSRQQFIAKERNIVFYGWRNGVYKRQYSVLNSRMEFRFEPAVVVKLLILMSVLKKVNFDVLQSETFCSRTKKL